MNIISWNVNGIRAVYKKNLLDQAFIGNDIVCFQEIKADHAQIEEILAKYPDFHVGISSSKTRKGYSGVAIFSKVVPISVTEQLPDDIEHKYQLDTDSYSNPNHEGRVITAEFKKFYLVNVYTPNSKPDLSRLSLREAQWDQAFLEYCKRLDAVKPVIFCGDLNVAHTPDDLTHPKANERTHGFTIEERKGIDNIIANGFIDTFRMFTEGPGHHTWWSPFAGARDRNVGWRIDYFFVSKKLEKKIVSSTILADMYGSDHCPVKLDISV